MIKWLIYWLILGRHKVRSRPYRPGGPAQNTVFHKSLDLNFSRSTDPSTVIVPLFHKCPGRLFNFQYTHFQFGVALIRTGRLFLFDKWGGGGGACLIFVRMEGGVFIRVETHFGKRSLCDWAVFFNWDTLRNLLLKFLSAVSFCCVGLLDKIPLKVLCYKKSTATCAQQTRLNILWPKILVNACSRYDLRGSKRQHRSESKIKI